MARKETLVQLLRRSLVVTAFGSATILFCSAASIAMPQTPVVYLNTSYPSLGGSTIQVAAGGNLQTAINSATCGQTIALAPGATFSGNFTLPNKSCSGWIVIRTDIPLSSLPPAGTRMTPAIAASLNLAKIVTPNSTAVITATGGAHHYRFVGVEISEQSSARAGFTIDGNPVPLIYALISVGVGSETSLASLPEFIFFDRCYIWARQYTQTSRGIALNGKSSAVFDSYLAGFKAVGFDSQAICGWNGPGPFKIVNNYLEGAGETIMFGGSDPKIIGLNPSDIEVRGNYFLKPISWITPFTVVGANGIPTQDRWTVKNTYESKNSIRVLVEGNVLENSWPDGQVGFHFVIKTANQSGTCTTCETRDYLIRHNIVKSAGGGANNAPYEPNGKPIPRFASNVRYENNLFYDISSTTMGSSPMMQVTGGGVPFNGLTMEHNTFVFGNTVSNLFAMSAPTPLAIGFEFRNNVGSKGSYGIKLSGGGEGTAALNGVFAQPYPFDGNVIAQVNPATYPAGNYYPAAITSIGFTDPTNADYSLAPSSPYKGKATDGKDPGVDFSLLRAYTAGAVTGVWSTSLPPPPPIVPLDTVAPAAPTGLQ